MSMNISINTIKNGVSSFFLELGKFIGNLGGRVVKLLTSLPDPLKFAATLTIANGAMLLTAYRMSNVIHDRYFKQAEPATVGWKRTDKLPTDGLNAVALFTGNYALNRLGNYNVNIALIAGIALAGSVALRIIWEKNAPRPLVPVVQQVPAENNEPPADLPPAENEGNDPAEQVT